MGFYHQRFLRRSGYYLLHLGGFKHPKRRLSDMSSLPVPSQAAGGSETSACVVFRILMRSSVSRKPLVLGLLRANMIRVTIVSICRLKFLHENFSAPPGTDNRESSQFCHPLADQRTIGVIRSVRPVAPFIRQTSVGLQTDNSPCQSPVSTRPYGRFLKSTWPLSVALFRLSKDSCPWSCWAGRAIAKYRRLHHVPKGRLAISPRLCRRY